MEGDRIEMSQGERDVLKVMSVVLSGKRTQEEAARLLRLSVRQVRRVQRRLQAEGDAGVVHRLRGRVSNRRLDAALCLDAIGIYKAEYVDFGPTLAAEKLLERGIKVSHETLRQWLLREGLWQRRRRREQHRSRRERRECFGELVQADGSPHAWLEGRGEEMALLVMIDDATSRTMARFYGAETTEGYMDLLGRYLRRHGRMVALYADRHTIFQAKDEDGNPTQTQVGRALRELGIELIPAHSPQAKGRVERFNRTAQDRLVKELRLAKASTTEDANRVLERAFLPWFNRRCTQPAVSPNDAHRRIHQSMDLAAILCVQEKRTVGNDYTIRHGNRIYQILPPAYPGLRGGKVVVENRRDGSIHLKFKGRYLKYEVVEPGAKKDEGALPPCPRSLTRRGMPAGAVKKEGRAAASARPSAVYPARGRSGRTPAEPCPPKGDKKHNGDGRWRPAADHPWKRPALVRPV